MAFWIPKTQVNPAVWISVFLLIPVLFNNFNVRRYGEFEYWLTVSKLVTISGLIILGILLPMGASAGVRLLGTDNNNQPIECPDPTGKDCLSLPGFQCIPIPSR
jgi:amino acid permease